MIGSLHLIEGKEEFPNTGTVLSVGPKVRENISVGDRVLFTRKPESALAGGWAKPGDEYYGIIALDESNIQGIITDEDLL